MNLDHKSKTFGQIIRYLRHDYGWSQTKLGDKVGVDYRTISNIERSPQVPRDDLIIRIGRALNCKPGQLLKYFYHKTQQGITFPRVIRIAYLDKCITARQAADRCHVGKSYMAKIIEGMRKPKYKTIIKIIVGLNLNPAKVLRLTGYSTKSANSYGFKLTEGIVKYGFSYRKLADVIHVSRQTIYNYVHNAVKPNIKVRRRISNALKED